MLQILTGYGSAENELMQKGTLKSVNQDFSLPLVHWSPELSEACEALHLSSDTRIVFLHIIDECFA